MSSGLTLGQARRLMEGCWGEGCLRVATGPDGLCNTCRVKEEEMFSRTTIINVVSAMKGTTRQIEVKR